MKSMSSTHLARTTQSLWRKALVLGSCLTRLKTTESREIGRSKTLVFDRAGNCISTLTSAWTILFVPQSLPFPKMLHRTDFSWPEILFSWGVNYATEACPQHGTCASFAPGLGNARTDYTISPFSFRAALRTNCRGAC